MKQDSFIAKEPVSAARAKAWRLFCAIELSEEVTARIRQHVLRLRDEVPESQASWSRLENIHLTVKFFGDVDASKFPRISSAADRAVSIFKPFNLSIGGAGAFPKPNRPQVLWIGIKDESGRLSELQEAVERECAVAGFPRENRAFRPHLTIARLRKPEGARVLAETNQRLGFEPISVLVSEVVVFRSELGRDGSKYTALSRHQMSHKL